MKNRAFLACMVLLPLLVGCGGKKSGTPGETVPPEVVTVQGMALVSAVSGEDGRTKLAIPETALFMRGQLEGVQVVGPDSIVSVRWVRTSTAFDGSVEVLSGLDEGEKVVAPHDAAVREGFKVTIKQ